MHIDLTPDQEALRDELRSYFASIPRSGHPTAWNEPRADDYDAVVRKLGADGWLGIGWPTSYGGQGRGPVEQLIFFTEAERARVPIPLIALNTVGPTLMRYGTEEQKDELLPKILRGEVEFAIGYTEPEAGTDLASLRTKATRDGDDYVIDGSKVFTSNADTADYVWLAARTDPEAPKHRGISIFLVPTSSEGFRVTPMTTVAGLQTTATYYEGVRVPASAIVGELDGGWKLITSQLNHERVALATTGWVGRITEDVVAWAREQPAPEGGRVVDRQWVQLNLARVYAMIEALKLFNWRVAAGLEHDELSPAEASALKVYGTETYIEIYRLLMEIVGRAAYLKRGSSGAVVAGVLEQAYRSAVILTFGGGVNEVQRMIIATAGLGMPRG